MNVDRSEAGAMQPRGRYKSEHLSVLRHRRHRKSMKQLQGLLAVWKVPAGELLDYERMDQNRARIQ